MLSIPDSLLDLFERPLVCSFSIVLPNGEIQSTPAWLIYDSQYVRINPFTELEMERSATSNSKVSIFIMDPTNSSHYAEVQGHITGIDEGSTEKQFEELEAKYRGEHNYLRQATKVQKLYVVFPDNVSGQ